MSEIEEIERRIELKEQELFFLVENKYTEIKDLRDKLKELKGVKNVS